METEKLIFTDVFNFLKDNIDVRNDPEYWRGIVEQTTEIEQKYKGNKLAVNMLYACTQRLCEIYDNDQKGGRADER